MCNIIFIKKKKLLNFISIFIKTNQKNYILKLSINLK